MTSSEETAFWKPPRATGTCLPSTGPGLQAKGWAPSGTRGQGMRHRVRLFSRLRSPHGSPDARRGSRFRPGPWEPSSGPSGKVGGQPQSAGHRASGTSTEGPAATGGDPTRPRLGARRHPSAHEHTRPRRPAQAHAHARTRTHAHTHRPTHTHAHAGPHLDLQDDLLTQPHGLQVLLRDLRKQRLLLALPRAVTAVKNLLVISQLGKSGPRTLLKTQTKVSSAQLTAPGRSHRRQPGPPGVCVPPSLGSAALKGRGSRASPCHSGHVPTGPWGAGAAGHCGQGPGTGRHWPPDPQPACPHLAIPGLAVGSTRQDPCRPRARATQKTLQGTAAMFTALGGGHVPLCEPQENVLTCTKPQLLIWGL